MCEESCYVFTELAQKNEYLHSIKRSLGETLPNHKISCDNKNWLADIQIWILYSFHFPPPRKMFCYRLYTEHCFLNESVERLSSVVWSIEREYRECFVLCWFLMDDMQSISSPFGLSGNGFRNPCNGTSPPCWTFLYASFCSTGLNWSTSLRFLKTSVESLWYPWSLSALEKMMTSH